MRLKYLNRIINTCILKEALCPQQRYAVFGKISAATLPDSSVTIVITMLFDESNKLTH